MKSTYFKDFISFKETEPRHCLVEYSKTNVERIKVHI